MSRVAALLLLVLLAVPVPRVAKAEVNICQMPSGETAYTDRRCDSLGAIERAAPSAQPRASTYRATCSRTLRDLAYELSAAIEAHDVNRLAGVYHWPGTSTRQGYATMGRLQAIVDRPLVDLQPMYPRSLDADLYPQAAVSRPPIGLRLSQVSKNGSTPIDTVFGLRRNVECWWVSEGGGRGDRGSAPRRATAAQHDIPAIDTPAGDDPSADPGPESAAPVN